MRSWGSGAPGFGLLVRRRSDFGFIVIIIIIIIIILFYFFRRGVGWGSEVSCCLDSAPFFQSLCI